MKKTLVITLLIGILALVGIFYYFIAGFTHSGPEFLSAQGEFVSEPTIEYVNDMYIITWSNIDNYPNNEVLLKSSTSKYPDGGVGAESKYDSVNNAYVHTATFRLTYDKAQSDFPTFAPGDYTYQVKSSGLSDRRAVINQVLDL